MIRLGKETVRVNAVFQVAAVFFSLGFVAFGGPAAHLALFREVFTQKRAWLDARRYDELMALCQFLPGPGSSQTAAAIGWVRAGPLGALTAMAAFAAPSILVMGLAGWGLTAFVGEAGSGAVGGLLAGAAAVVAGAVLSMARRQAATPVAAAIAAASLVVLLAAGASPLPLAAVQPGVIALGALAGGLWLSGAQESRPDFASGSGAIRAGLAWLSVFVVLLAGLPVLAGTGEAGRLADAAYRAGALVFGGGHVVLPLLEAGAVPDLVDEQTFLAGYGLAQAIPGPLFTFAAYIGAAAADTPLEAAGYVLLAVGAIFAPGLILVYAALPVWGRLKDSRRARGALRGAAAAVTGVLAAALVDPVLPAVPREPAAYGILAVAFLALRFRAPPPLVMLGCALAGWLAL